MTNDTEKPGFWEKNFVENHEMWGFEPAKKAPIYAKGKFISKDRYEIFDGVKMFFYDRESVRAEFSQPGLFEISEVEDVYPFFLIKCKKAN